MVAGVLFIGCGNAAGGAGNDGGTSGGDNGANSGNSSGSSTQALDVDATEITLSDGTWLDEVTTSYTYTDDEYGAEVVISWISSEKITIAGDKITYVSGSSSQVYVYTFPESTTDAKIENFIKKIESDDEGEGEGNGEDEAAPNEPAPEVKIEKNGKSVKVTMSADMSAEKIAALNATNPTVSEMTDHMPPNAVIKTNSAKTEYKITFTQKGTDGEPDRDIVNVLKKQ